METDKIKQILRRNRNLVDVGDEGYDYENLVLLCEKVSNETEKEVFDELNNFIMDCDLNETSEQILDNLTQWKKDKKV